MRGPVHACYSYLSVFDFTFLLQTVQLIAQGVAYFRQRSPHRPHAELRVDADLLPLPGGWR